MDDPRRVARSWAVERRKRHCCDVGGSALSDRCVASIMSGSITRCAFAQRTIFELLFVRAAILINHRSGQHCAIVLIINHACHLSGSTSDLNINALAVVRAESLLLGRTNSSSSLHRNANLRVLTLALLDLLLQKLLASIFYFSRHARIRHTRAFMVPCRACLWFLRNLGSVPLSDGYLLVLGFLILCVEDVASVMRSFLIAS